MDIEQLERCIDRANAYESDKLSLTTSDARKLLIFVKRLKSSLNHEQQELERTRNCLLSERNALEAVRQERDDLRAKLAAMESQAKQLITKACCNAVEKLTELAPNQGWDSGEVVAEMYIRQLSDKPVPADKPASAQEKADLIMSFVNQIAAAYTAGFTPYPHMTLQQLHRVAQHHVYDELGIDTDDFEKAFGAELFAECRAISQGWDKPAVTVPDEMTSDRAKDFIVADDEKELLRFVQGFNCCRDSFMSVRPSHSQQSAE